MHIVCPHCSTSYAVSAATFGERGRPVRCARCHNVWQARPEPLSRQPEKIPELAAQSSGSSVDDNAAWGLPPDDDDQATPIVDSPSILSSMPADEPESVPSANIAQAADQAAVSEGIADTGDTHVDDDTEPKQPGRVALVIARLRSMVPDNLRNRLPATPRISSATLALILVTTAVSIVFWRAQIVRLAPQTATFYRLIGMDVNLRQLALKDVKMSSETQDGTTVLIIQGVVVGQARQPQPVPRMRFVIRNDAGTEIYAWNLLLDQASLGPGETIPFRSRLAHPPEGAHQIDVRFFNSRDIPDRGA